MVATRSSYQRAIDKAESLGGARLVVSVTGAVYTVRGSVAPAAYTVTLGADGELHCSCPAGSRDIPCYHAAAVKLRQWGEQAAGHIARAAVHGPDSASAPLAHRSCLGIGMSRRWD